MISKKVICFLTFLVNSSVLPSFAQTIKNDSIALIQADNNSTKILVKSADSSIFHLPIFIKGYFLSPFQLQRNSPEGNLNGFTIMKRLYHDRIGDSLLTFQLKQPAKTNAEIVNQIWAYCDGKQIYLATNNKFMTGCFYPLYEKNGHYYYRYYDGPVPDAVPKAIIQGLLFGVGVGFDAGNVGVGISGIPMFSNRTSINKKLPPHHIKWMEYSMRTGESKTVLTPPF